MSREGYALNTLMGASGGWTPRTSLATPTAALGAPEVSFHVNHHDIYWSVSLDASNL